jgi:hypothetical protein
MAASLFKDLSACLRVAMFNWIWITAYAQLELASTPAVDRDLPGVAVADVVRPLHDHARLCGLKMIRRWPRVTA